MDKRLTVDDDDGSRTELASAYLVPQKRLDRQGFEPGDLFLGRTMSGKPFGLYDDLNVMTCAGTRAGKGVASVIPNLLMFPGTTVVVDPKGELAEATAAYRRDQLGQKVIVLDPANTANIDPSLRGTFNPLDELDPKDELEVVAAAQTIASGIVIPNPNAKEPFWDQTATNYIQALILYLINHYPKEMRTLQKLRELLSLGDWDLYQEYLALMREDDPEFEAPASKPRDLLFEEMVAMDHYGGLIRESAMKVRLFGDQTQGNVLGGAITHLDFLNEPKLRASLQSATDPERTFTLSELRRQDKHLTVYLCLPVDMMYHQGRWMRLIVSQIVQYIERTSFDKRSDYPVLLMIDEFFQLGPIPSIVNTLTYAPGFGLRLWLIVQDLNQIKANYPETWETILGACGIKQFFGINDLTTAKYVSEMIGKREIGVPSVATTVNLSTTEGTSQSVSIGRSRSVARGETETDTFTVNVGYSNSIAETRSRSISVGSGTNTSQGSSYGAGTNASTGTNEGWNTGSQTGVSGSETLNYERGNQQHHSGSKNTGSSSGTSSGRSGGHSSSQGVSSNQSKNFQSGSSTSRQATDGISTSSTHTDTYSEARGGSFGTSYTETDGESETRQDGTSSSQTKGQSFTYTMNRQMRPVFHPEELLLAFTRQNLTQLVYVRDYGPLVLFRAPYYADPDFQRLISYQEDFERKHEEPTND